MKRIAIDMDEVIADFHFKHLNLYNRDFNETLSKEDLFGTRLWNLGDVWQQASLNWDMVSMPPVFAD